MKIGGRMQDAGNRSKRQERQEAMKIGGRMQETEAKDKKNRRQEAGCRQQDAGGKIKRKGEPR